MILAFANFRWIKFRTSLFFLTNVVKIRQTMSKFSIVNSSEILTHILKFDGIEQILRYRQRIDEK